LGQRAENAQNPQNTTPEHPWLGDGHYSAPRDLAYLRQTAERLGW